MIGPILTTIGSTIGNIAGGAVSAVGSAASGIGSLGAGALSTIGSVGGAALQGAWEAPGAIVKGVGGLVSSLPAIAEKAKPVADVLGGVYGAYTSYEQSKAAREAMEKFGSQTSLGGPIGNVPVIVPSASAPSYAAPGNPPMTEEERLMREAMGQGEGDTERFLMWGGLGLLAVLVLRKKK